MPAASAPRSHEHLAGRFHLAIHYRDSEREAAQLKLRLENADCRVELFRADLGDASQAAELVPVVVREMGRLDLIVNNASHFAYDTPSSFDAEAMKQALAVDLIAPLVIAREFARVGSADATLVQMLDNKVFAPNPDFFSYTLAKMALARSVELLAQHFGQRLRVAGIAPSVTLISGSQTPENFEKARQRVLGPGGPTPADIARTVEYIWTTRSIDGEIIVLDGGQRLMGLERDVAFLEE